MYNICGRCRLVIFTSKAVGAHVRCESLSTPLDEPLKYNKTSPSNYT